MENTMGGGLIDRATRAGAGGQPAPAGANPDEMAATQPGSAASGMADDEGGEPATAEEQQWYDAVQQAAGDILFNDDKASETVVSMINPKQPGLSAGNAAAEVLLQVDRAMDGEVPETVILPAGAEILDHVLDIGQAAKLFERTPQIEEEAAQSMSARLMQEYGVDQDDFAQAQQAIGFQPPAGAGASAG